MSFIDLKKVMEHGLKDGALQPGDKLCPEMSRYGLKTVPLKDEVELEGVSVLCIGEFCGKFNACQGTQAKPK